ncbi:hypothetical protein Tco_0001837, partial [Tanacetum coccineum]
MGYFQIIRADGSLRRNSSMIKMLQNINKEDLETLWKLVKAIHGNTRPEEAYERERIVGIKRIHDDLEVNTAKVRVTAAKHNLVLLVILVKNMLIRMTKVIKGEFEKIKDVKVEDVSLTCDTPFEVFNNEVSRLSGMDDDLFTYEVEVANISCHSKIDDDSEHEADDDMGYDTSDVSFTEWLGSKIFNYKTMDLYTVKALWIYWIRGDDEVELTDEESSDNIGTRYCSYEGLAVGDEGTVHTRVKVNAGAAVDIRLAAASDQSMTRVSKTRDRWRVAGFPSFPSQENKYIEILQALKDLMEAIQAFLKEYDHIPPNKKCMALLLVEERFLKIKKTMEEEQNQPEVMQELLLKIMNDLKILKGSQQEIRRKQLKSRIPFGLTPKVILIAWESFGKIKDALTDEQYQQEDIQELMSKILEDVRNISEELSEYINCPSWNRPIFYDNDDDEYTIIYSKPKAITPDLLIEEPDNSLIMGDEYLDTIPSVEELVPIPSKFEGIFEDTCDVPVCEDPSTFDALHDHSEILSDPTMMRIRSTSPFPIPVTDSDSSFEKSDTSLSHSDNSLPEFETFSYHTEETSSGSTTTHANNSLPEYDSFHFEIEPDQGELTNVVMEDILGEPRVHVPNVLPTHPTLMMDSDFIIRTFLPFFTYPVTSSSLLSSGSEDTIFDPGISTFHFSSLKPVAHENPIVIFLFFCFCPKDKGIRGEIPQDHEDPCLFSILQSSGLRSFAYFGILNPDH